MAHALAKENEAFIRRMVKSGRYNNQSEVVREALRRMEREDRSFLTPAPLTPAQLEEAYGPHPEDDAQERTVGQAAFRSIRRAAKKGSRP